MQMMRIQSFSMGYAGFQKPVVQNPGLRGIFDFQAPQMPQFPEFDLPLAAGSPSGGGGADGGGAAPAPAPAPGAPAPAAAPGPAAPDFAPNFVAPPPANVFVTQEQPPLPMPPQPAPAPAIPMWAIVGGSLLAGLGIAALLFKQG